jgi:excisionase family DNA binding protein
VQPTKGDGGGPSGPEVLTPCEAAALLNVTINHVYRLLNTGRMPGRRVGGVWRIPRSQLLAWLEGTG